MKAPNREEVIKGPSLISRVNVILDKLKGRIPVVLGVIAIIIMFGIFAWLFWVWNMKV